MMAKLKSTDASLGELRKFFSSGKPQMGFGRKVLSH